MTGKKKRERKGQREKMTNQKERRQRKCKEGKDE